MDKLHCFGIISILSEANCCRDTALFYILILRNISLTLLLWRVFAIVFENRSSLKRQRTSSFGTHRCQCCKTRAGRWWLSPVVQWRLESNVSVMRSCFRRVWGRLSTRGRTSSKIWWVTGERCQSISWKCYRCCHSWLMCSPISLGHSCAGGSSLCCCWSEWADGTVWGYVHTI